jgi:indole-3-glycerol phosphate synthase
MIATADLLSTIVAATRRVVEVRQGTIPASVLERQGTRMPLGGTFAAALRHSTPPRVIAECKRRSPSKGILRADYDPAAHASDYAAAGAAAISVLTEPTFFDGSLDHLAQVRAVVEIPILRKDFVVSEYQLLEAVALGADAVLLIAGALTDEELLRLRARATALGLASLVEVHDRDELTRALDAGAEVIGVNSRNLRTLAVDMTVLDDLIGRIPPDATAVAESGIRSGSDMMRLMDAGYHAFLVGERLIAQPDPGRALRELRAQAREQRA